jgi:ceramide glucosyltransferase
MFFQWLGIATALVALAGAMYAALASVLVVVFRLKSFEPPHVAASAGDLCKACPSMLSVRSAPIGLPAVTLFKPLHLDEIGLAGNLETFFLQDYPAPVQIVFGVQSEADPAIGIVKALQAKYPDRDTAIIVNSTRHGSNAKVSNLINMFPAGRHDVVVVSDSDISAPPDRLTAVVSALGRPRVGIVTCLYTGKALTVAPRFWPVISAMGMSYDFLPNVVVATSLGLEAACMGSTIAFKREILESIGGFSAFADYLADDYEIGRAVRARGHLIAMPTMTVHHSATDQSVYELFQHELRWARTIRSINPAGYLGSVLTFGVPFAVASTILLGFSTFSLWALAATCVARISLKYVVDQAFDANGGPSWLLPFRDLFSFIVFCVSLFGSTVQWRGTRFDLADRAMILRPAKASDFRTKPHQGLI